jgi:hypothetical protein
MRHGAEAMAGHARKRCGRQYHGRATPSRAVRVPCPEPHARANPFERDLDRNVANYTPLSPLSLIARAAYTYPQQLAVVHGDRRYTWAETYARSRRLRPARGHRRRRHRRAHGVEHARDGRSALACRMTGGVPNTLNTRLDAEAIDHARAREAKCSSPTPNSRRRSKRRWRSS